MTTIETNKRGQVIITCSDLPIKEFKNASYEEKKMIAVRASKEEGEESISDMKKHYESLSDDEKVKFLKTKFRENRFAVLLKELGLKVEFGK